MFCNLLGTFKENVLLLVMRVRQKKYRYLKNEKKLQKICFSVAVRLDPNPHGGKLLNMDLL